MANLKARDADSLEKFLKATGTGEDTDPLVIEHSNPPLLAQLQQAVTQLTTVISQLQDVAPIKTQLQSSVGVNTAVTNFPATQAVSGNVGITNFPATQPVSGSVSVANFPTTQPISGSVGINNFPATQPVSGSVNVGNFPATQPISGSVNVGNFPATQPISGSVAVNNFPVIQPISDSQVTSVETAVALAAGASFSGLGRDATNKNTIRGWVWTNANGTLYVDQSTNNTTWRQIDTIPITGSTTQATDYSFKLMTKYYRLRYTNGTVAQTTFELISTIFGLGL